MVAILPVGLFAMPQPVAIPAFDDNYIWQLDLPDGWLLVDPGDAAPVLAKLGERDAPAAILITHHHGDHIGGLPALANHWPGVEIFAPEDERIPIATRRVHDGDVVDVAGSRFDVIAVPGHTRSHIAYFGEDVLFCGDALFSLGCGRLFEGDGNDLWVSMSRIAALPGETLVCCAHEYTLSNAAFADSVIPANAALASRIAEARAQRAAGQPTLPARLSSELAANPFLRAGHSDVMEALWARGVPASATLGERLGTLRAWKDEFRA